MFAILNTIITGEQRKVIEDIGGIDLFKND
jgi:hypothetical protein